MTDVTMTIGRLIFVFLCYVYIFTALGLHFPVYFNSPSNDILITMAFFILYNVVK